MERTNRLGEVDFAFLQGYAAGDETFVREVLSLFRAEAAEWDGLLRAGAPDWRALVHTLKGSSRSIGAARLGDLCERAEAEGESALPDVRAALARVLVEIEGYIADRDTKKGDGGRARRL